MTENLDNAFDNLLRRRALRRALKIFSIVLLSLSLPFSAFAAYKENYSLKLLPNTYVGDFNLSHKRLNEARDTLRDLASRFENQKYLVKDDEGNAFEITPKELGIKVDVDSALREAFARGHSGNFSTQSKDLLLAPFQPRQVFLNWQIDNAFFEKALQAKVKDLEKTPENAQIQVTAGEITVIPMVAGRKIDSQRLSEDFKQLFSKEIINDPQIKTVKLSYTLIEPAITDEYATSVANNLKKIVSEDLVLTYEGKSLRIPKTELASWLTLTPRENTIEVTLDQNKVFNSLTKAGKSIEKPAKPKKISTKDGSVIEEGEDGLQVDKKTMFQNILEAFTLNSEVNHNLSLVVNKIPAGERRVAPEETFTPGMYPGKYIEIDLSKQMLAAFEGENKFMEARVSTGRWSMPTPTGVFSINNKNPRAYSRNYGLYMPWWMAFIGSEYGIHELPEWPNGAKEGESHLGIPVSHGCVRLGVGPAKQLYDWAEIGTIVYIHK